MGSGPRGITDHAGPFRTLGIKQPQNSIVPTTWQFSVWFEDFKNISPLLRIYSSLPRQLLLLRLEIRNPPRLILTGHVYYDMTCGGGGGGWKLKVIQVRSKARRGQKGQRKNEHALNSAERQALHRGPHPCYSAAVHEPQHGHRLGACEKCKILASTPDLGHQNLHCNKIPRRFLCKHCPKLEIYSS